jgi:hypothetical protein
MFQVILLQANKESPCFSFQLSIGGGSLFSGSHDLVFQARLAEEKTGFSRRYNDKHNGEKRHPRIKILASQFKYVFALTHRIDSAGVVHALYSLTNSEAEPGEKTRTQNDQRNGVVGLPQHGWL